MLSLINTSAESSRISFEEAKASLIEFRLHEMNTPINSGSVHYLRIRDVDSSGNAAGWIFGVHNGREAEFLVYDRTGWTTIRNVTLPDEEFALDSVVSPAVLFKQSTAVVLGDSPRSVPERRDIELQRGLYKLTITSDNTQRTLTFNATTGMLITER